MCHTSNVQKWSTRLEWDHEDLQIKTVYTVSYKKPMHIRVTNKTTKICLLSRYDLCTLSVLHWNYAFSSIRVRPKILTWGNRHWSRLFCRQVYNLEQTPSTYESHTDVILRPPRHLSYLEVFLLHAGIFSFLNSVHCLLAEHISKIYSQSLEVK
jgi:hypothetical protein